MLPRVILLYYDGRSAAFLSEVSIVEFGPVFVTLEEIGERRYILFEGDIEVVRLPSIHLEPTVLWNSVSENLNGT